jgi:CheY-like chemotaxis protein
VTEAASAREALDVLRHERPDVLVSDLSMPPGEDGYWLIGAVRALAVTRLTIESDEGMLVTLL